LLWCAICACGPTATPSERFKQGGAGRLAAWNELQPKFNEVLASASKTKAGLASTVEQWLGKPEPAAMKACENLVVWAGSPQPIDGDVAVYLLSQDADGFKRYLVVDFRDPAHPGFSEASMTGPPSKPNDPHDRISDVERATAKEIDAIEINLGGGSEDGSYKSGYRLWIQNGQGSLEVFRKAATLSTLVCVDLEGKQVTDAWLAPLAGHPYITSMTLRSTSVTDAGLPHLCGLHALKWLTLEKSGVTESEIRMLRTALPKCKITIKP
jgi:hypothetical protein